MRIDARLNNYSRHYQSDPNVFDLFSRRHPRFLDPQTPWLSLNTTDDELREARLTLDASGRLARVYDFRDWAALKHFARQGD